MIKSYINIKNLYVFSKEIRLTRPSLTTINKLIIKYIKL